jgi:hypothetical protein
MTGELTSQTERRPQTPPRDESELPPEVEQACDLIDRLEMYRQCLDEAVADAYTELAAALNRHQAATAVLIAGS